MWVCALELFNSRRSIWVRLVYVDVSPSNYQASHILWERGKAAKEIFCVIVVLWKYDSRKRTYKNRIMMGFRSLECRCETARGQRTWQTMQTTLGSSPQHNAQFFFFCTQKVCICVVFGVWGVFTQNWQTQVRSHARFAFCQLLAFTVLFHCALNYLCL